MAIPLVSISLPTYNRAHILNRAIESVLHQTFTDFELIVIDDGSTDNTKSLIDSYADSRIRFVRHETNKGLYPSRNTGLNHSRGMYLAFQDSDDEWHPKKLEEEVLLLQETPESIGGVFSQIEKNFFSGKKAFVPSSGYVHTPYLLPHMLRGDFYITMQALLLKKTCLEKVPAFDESFQVFGDGDFILRIAEHYEFLYNPHVRVTLHVLKDSISRNKVARRKGREYLFLKHQNLYAKHPSSMATYAYTLARAFVTVKEYDFEKAQTYAYIALAKKPFSVSNIFSFLRIILFKIWTKIYRI